MTSLSDLLRTELGGLDEPARNRLLANACDLLGLPETPREGTASGGKGEQNGA